MFHIQAEGNIPSECVFTSVIEKYLSRIPKSIQLLFSVHSYAWILEKPKFNNNNNFSLWDQQKFNKASCVYHDSFGFKKILLVPFSYDWTTFQKHFFF